MRHTENHQDLSEAALVAAEDAVNRSAEMLQYGFQEAIHLFPSGENPNFLM